MKPVDKSNRDAARARQSFKTKDDFLRWLRKKNPRQKRLAQDDVTQADHVTSRALMVWADDGGATG